MASYSDYVRRGLAANGIHERRHFASSRDFSEWTQEAWEAAKGTGQHIEYFYREEIDRVYKGIRILADGDDTYAAQAQALVDKFAEDRLEVQTYNWQPAYSGPVFDLGAVIRGEPMWALQLQPDFSERTPLRVWIGLTSSAGVSDDQLRQRGCVLAAFALAVSAKRPVYITPYVNMGWLAGPGGKDSRNGLNTSATISWDIQTSPLVLSELVGVTANSDVTRHVGITSCSLLNPATSGNCNPLLANDTKMREILGAQPQDLHLGQIHLYDPMLSDPIGWLRTNVAKYTEDAEEAA